MQLVFISLSLDPPIVCNQGDHYVATTTNQFLQCGHAQITDAELLSHVSFVAFFYFIYTSEQTWELWNI